MSRKKGQHYSLGFKEQVLERMRLGERIRLLGWELKVPKSVLYEWRKQAEGRPGGKQYEAARKERDQEVAALEARIAELEGVVGRQTLELDFFAAALRRVEGSGQGNREAGEKASGPKSAAGCSRKAD